MSEIYVLRTVLDAKEDVIRDIAIAAGATLMELHYAIIEAFGLSEGEMSSFFRSNEDWDQGEEISMMDFNPTNNSNALEEIKLGQIFENQGSRMLFAYDYLNLWTFYLEQIDSRGAEAGKTYPALVGKLGETPSEAPDKSVHTAEGDLNGHLDEDPFSEDEDEDDLPDDWY